MTTNEKKYDKKGRLIYDFETITSTLYKYKYSKDEKTRVITITNDKNKSNHKTVIEQLMLEGEYVNKIKTEEGDIYTLKTTFNDKGEQIRFEQINKKKKTNLVKNILRPGNAEAEIWVINYEGKKNIGFKINPSKLKKN